MIKKVLILIFLTVLGSGMAYSQATIKGTIVDETGEKLIGVIVMLKSNSSLAVATDLDG
jgi:hypothetical protein